MFPTATSTAVLSRTARSARQSGLKKPRPVRSISLQEQHDREVKKLTLDRQLSSPASTEEGSEETYAPVCEGISALSALITAQAVAEAAANNPPTDPVVEQQVSPPIQERQEVQPPPPSFDRQDSSSSYNSCLDSESSNSFYSLSRQNSITAECITAAIHKQHQSTPATSFTHRPYYAQDSKAPSAPLVDVNSNNIHLKESYQDNTFSLSRTEDDFSTIPLVTLLTTQGEKLIVTGRSMPTILNASKILVKEMGASIIGMRFEDLNDESMRRQETRSPANQSQTSSRTDTPSPPVQMEEQSQKEKKAIRYSKDDLLAMSECDIARRPPANWNILIHTHSDCCLPADQMKEYFEAEDFHRSDGTLVTEDKRLRGDRRDRDHREPMRDSREYREPMRSTRENREPMRDTKEYREPMRDTRDHREPMRDSREYREPMRDSREYREPTRDSREYREPTRDTREYREPTRDTREYRERLRDREYQEPIVA